jgi:hypothetical protein
VVGRKDAETTLDRSWEGHFRKKRGNRVNDRPDQPVVYDEGRPLTPAEKTQAERERP